MGQVESEPERQEYSLQISLVDTIRTIAFFTSLCAILGLFFHYLPNLGFASVWLSMGIMVIVLALTAMAATYIKSTCLVLLSIILLWSTAIAYDLLSSQIRPVVALREFVLFASSHCVVFLFLKFVVAGRNKKRDGSTIHPRD